MSMQEMFGLHMEILEIKNLLQQITGMKFDGTKLISGQEEEIKKIKKILYDVVQEYILIKERINKMTLNLEALAAEVTRAQTVQSSAVTLLKKLTGELERISAQMTEMAAQTPPQIDTAPLNDLIDKLKTSTDSLASAVSDSTNVTPVTEVVLNAEDTSKPTVQVIMPEILPENVVVTAEQVVPTVDNTSTEPQVVVTVQPAPAPEAVTTEAPAAEAPAAEAPAVDAPTAVIETPEGQVNVNVEVSPETAAVAEAAGVNVVEAVKDAIAEAEVPAEPAPASTEPTV